MLVLLFFHVKITVNNSKFQHSVMWSVCEIGLQGWCFTDHVASLAFGMLRWDSDGFLWNKTSLPQLSVWLLGFLGASLVYSD